jgi:K+ transporter|tara:strand:- start:2068 stop:2439 length:372 start_codon:yes stop_codon:yes gene_type:complete
MFLDFVKNHWKEIALAILLFVVSFFWWQDHRGLVRAYEASTNSLEERIDGLKESYEIEALKKDEALADYKKQVFILEAERMDFIEELENRKTERKVEFVKMRRNDPEGFILKIETQFGFEHVE